MKALGRTFAGAWSEAWANRRGFWTQVIIMIVNDIMWITFWVLFFERVGTIHGWDVEMVLILLAVLTTSGGVVLGFFNNTRHIGELAANGGLDAALALPTPTLPHLLVRKIEATNVGDVLFGVGLFLALGEPTLERSALFVFGVVCASLILTGFLVLMGSLSFFAGRNEAGDLGFHAILLFSAYPVDIFAGATKLFLFTVVPAGFVTSVPAKLVDDFNLGWATALLAVAAGIAAAGALVFRIGLRRYTSGAVWTEA